MARGYWGPGVITCRDCNSGPKSKFICETCLHACKAPNGGSPHCPRCRTAMRNMGQRWRPAKRGRRKVPLRYPVRLPSPGERLLAKITGRPAQRVLH